MPAHAGISFFTSLRHHFRKRFLSPSWWTKMPKFLRILIFATQIKDLAGILLSAGLSLMAQPWLATVFGILAAMLFFAAT